MFSRRRLGITIASALAAIPAARVAAQTGHTPLPTADPASPKADTPAAWSAEVIDLAAFDGVPLLLSPDGRLIAGMEWGGYLRIIDLATGEVTAVDNDVTFAPDVTLLDWSPDSTRLACARSVPEGTLRELCVVDVASGAVTTPVSDNAMTYDDSLPTFTVDGDSVSFVRTLRTGDSPASSIMEVNLATGKMRMPARAIAGDSSYVYGELHRLADNSLVYGVNWNPDRAIDFTPGI